jgi:hypothetical protein
MLLQVKKSENYKKISKSFRLRSHILCLSKKIIQLTLIMCNLQPTADQRKIIFGSGSILNIENSSDFTLETELEGRKK